MDQIATVCRIFVMMIITALFSYTIIYHIYQPIYAHDFFVNNDATLVTLVEQIKAETQLVNTNFLSDNNSSAQAHARNIAGHTNDLKDLLKEGSSASSSIAQIYENEQRNSTSLALVVANMVDEILRKYGTAFDIGYDLTNMSNMVGSDMFSMSEDSTSHAMNMILTPASRDGSNSNDTSGGYSNMSMRMNKDLPLYRIYDYETAKILSENVNRLFGDDLRPLSLVSETDNIDKLENNLRQLKYSIEVKASPEDLMNIVHVQIHPTLQKVYDLDLLDSVVTESQN
jgi:hypothetical protein